MKVSCSLGRVRSSVVLRMETFSSHGVDTTMKQRNFAASPIAVASI